MVLLRRLLGDELRRQRQRQHRTLREVSSAARVSLGYLSEVERGQKEASSELLSSICTALDVPMSQVLRGVSDELALAELRSSTPTDISPVSSDVVASAAPTWSLVRAALADLLGAGTDPALVEVTLSWLVGQLAAPQDPELRARCARLLAGVAQH